MLDGIIDAIIIDAIIIDAIIIDARIIIEMSAPDQSAPLRFDGPLALPVTVTMTRYPSAHRWQRYRWRLSRVVVGAHVLDAAGGAGDAEDGEPFVSDGLALRLYKDEGESYYHGLMAPTPSLYVICRRDDDDRPRPFCVTASFDAAHAYQEGDEDVYALPLSPALCGWLERYVLTHYVPEPRRKRQRADWKNPS